MAKKTLKSNIIEKTNNEKLNEEFVKKTKGKKETKKQTTLEEAQKALDNVDTTIVNGTVEPEPDIKEVENIVNEINKINDAEKEFAEKFENVKSQEEAEAVIKDEIEKVEKEKEIVEKIINRPQRERTSSWNGISYGY